MLFRSTHAKASFIAAGKDNVEGAIQHLVGFVDRLRKRTDPNNLTLDARMRIAGDFGVRPGDVTPELASQYIENMSAAALAAAEELRNRQRPAGAPRKRISANEAQSQLFGEAAPKETPEEFGASLPGEEVVEEPTDTTPIQKVSPELVGPPTLEETEIGGQRLTDKQIRKGLGKPGQRIEPPEHAIGTEEGRVVQQFFQDVKPASESPEEVKKHEALRQNAAEVFTTYDIVEPGTRTSEALQYVRDVLAARVGGIDKLNALLERLPKLSAAEQSSLFKKAGLPDLTTRRGMEEFYHDIQVDIEHSYDVEKSIYNLRGRSAPAVALKGTQRPTLPYTEPQFETEVGEVRKYKGTTENGKLPRQAEVVYKKIVHAFSDTKIRAAMMHLRQKIENRKGVTKEDLAAKTYFDRRESATGALQALAFDLAMYDVEARGYEANYNHIGEGGAYAQRFQIGRAHV